MIADYVSFVHYPPECDSVAEEKVLAGICVEGIVLIVGIHKEGRMNALLFQDIQYLDCEVGGPVIKGQVDRAQRQGIAGIIALRP